MRAALFFAAVMGYCAVVTCLFVGLGLYFGGPPGGLSGFAVAVVVGGYGGGSVFCALGWDDKVFDWIEGRR